MFQRLMLNFFQCFLLSVQYSVSFVYAIFLYMSSIAFYYYHSSPSRLPLSKTSELILLLLKMQVSSPRSPELGNALETSHSRDMSMMPQTESNAESSDMSPSQNSRNYATVPAVQRQALLGRVPVSITVSFR